MRIVVVETGEQEDGAAVAETLDPVMPTKEVNVIVGPHVDSVMMDQVAVMVEMMEHLPTFPPTVDGTKAPATHFSVESAIAVAVVDFLMKLKVVVILVDVVVALAVEDLEDVAKARVFAMLSKVETVTVEIRADLAMI